MLCEQLNHESPERTIICLPSDDPNPHSRYGQGFYFSKTWQPHIWGIKRISYSILVIKFLANKSNTRNIEMTIINVYAPTSILSRSDTEDFYDLLDNTIRLKQKCSLSIVAGDFNTKVNKKGQRQEISELYMVGMEKAQEMKMDKDNFSLCGYIHGKNKHNQIDYICIL